MFNDEVKIGKYRVTIQLEGDLCRQTDQGWLFGYAVGFDPLAVNSYNVREKLPLMRGYWLYLGYDAERLIVANDITGGYRLYTYETGNDVFLSDDPSWLTNRMNARGVPTRNDNEYEYWKRHRFTTGERTFIRGLSKLAPAGILEVTNAGVSRDNYFPDTVCVPNHNTHRDLCRLDLEQTLENLRAENGPLVLMFSGGADSTLLASLLKQMHLPFTAVCLRSVPAYEANHADWQRARQVAKALEIELVTLDVELDRALRKHRAFIQRTPFDRHMGLVLAEGMHRIAEHFGSEAVIINGQGADSILSFGPSERRPGSFASRVLLYRPFTLRSRLAALVVSARQCQHFEPPVNWREYYRAFMDEVSYNCVLRPGDTDSYCQYLDDLVVSLAAQFSSRDALQMYLKCYGFLQGSDNQVVLQAARAAGLPHIILPYCTCGFIAATIAAKDDRRELWRPKYVIHDMLTEIGVSLTSIERPATDVELVNLVDLVDGVDSLYSGYADQIFTAPAVGERTPL